MKFIVLAILIVGAFCGANSITGGSCDLSCAKTEFVDHSADPVACKAHSITDCEEANDSAAKGTAVCTGCATGKVLVGGSCVDPPTSGAGFHADCSRYGDVGGAAKCVACPVATLLLNNANTCVAVAADITALEETGGKCEEVESDGADNTGTLKCNKCASGTYADETAAGKCWDWVEADDKIDNCVNY